ncbi:MAG: immune inhibitor A, partial [Anaerolineae bacterium]|nr:immune inhibitor A [Anaerolineae bacterium]
LQAVDQVLQARGEPGVDDLFGDWVLANALFDPEYGDGRYGYQELPPLMTPPPLAAVTDYPFVFDGATNQYAAGYFVLSNLSGARSLDIDIDHPDSVGLIPVNAASGEQMWYSNRGDMADTRLTRAFDLSGTTQATLNYRLWYDTEESWDYGYVMVSDDGGASWDILTTPHTTGENPHSVAYGTGYSGTSDGWVTESISLDVYAGKPILLRFEMITDDAVTRPGMAIDDVSIPEIGYTDDFEGENDGWLAEGWLRMDNRLPQRGWLQIVQRAGGETVAVQRQEIGADHRVDLVEGVDQVLVAVSPLAPVTTVPMPYTLSVRANS